METKIKNLDEVIFEERNQNYGAYFLRKNYHKIVSTAMFVTITIFTGITSIPLIAGYFVRPVEPKIDVNYIYEPLIQPIKDEVKIKLPEAPALPKKIESFKLTQLAVVEHLDNDNNIIELIENFKENIPISNGGDGNIIIDEDIKEIVIIEQAAPIHVNVELMPCFIGGEEELFKWLAKNIKYPQLAIETGVMGTVVVTFVVEKDGNISNVQLLNDIGGRCGEEAIRVVKSMPKWKAGRQNSEFVRVQFNLPIRFNLE